MLQGCCSKGESTGQAAKTEARICRGRHQRAASTVMKFAGLGWFSDEGEILK